MMSRSLNVQAEVSDLFCLSSGLCNTQMSQLDECEAYICHASCAASSASVCHHHDCVPSWRPAAKDGIRGPTLHVRPAGCGQGAGCAPQQQQQHQRNLQDAVEAPGVCVIHGCSYMSGKQSAVLPGDTWDVCQKRRPHRRSTMVSQFQCPGASASCATCSRASVPLLS